MQTRVIKIAETDLYGIGKFIKGSKLRDNTKPAKGHDVLLVDKGQEYYESTDENGVVNGRERKVTFDMWLEKERFLETLI